MTILYEDYDIIVVNKKQGLLTVGSDKVVENTAYFLLNEYVRKGNFKSKNKALIVHRLDRDTSGVLVFAKSDAAQKNLQEQWQSCTKTYTAIVHGKMPAESGTITSYLAENSALRMYSTPDASKGKLSTTHYKVLKEDRGLSWVELSIETGRKNQIRVHLADEGCPVAGDGKYGEKDRSMKRLYLHAQALKFKHPFSGEEMEHTASVPRSFDALMKHR